jgi:hypothetical protein
MERLITSHEAAIVRRLLDHAPVGGVTVYRAHPLEDLRVVGGCDCGCTSLRFQPPSPGQKIIADAIAVYPDDRQAGLILWGRDGQIVMLEVYDCHPGASHRVPELAHLRTWE